MNKGNLVSMDIVKDANNNYYKVLAVKHANDIITEIVIENFFYNIAYKRSMSDEGLQVQYDKKPIGDFLIDMLDAVKKSMERQGKEIYSLDDLHERGIKIAIRTSEYKKSVEV